MSLKKNLNKVRFAELSESKISAGVRVMCDYLKISGSLADEYSLYDAVLDEQARARARSILNTALYDVRYGGCDEFKKE